jgi:reactive intermediate/imine deaminase
MRKLLVLCCALPMLGCQANDPETAVEWLNPPGTDTSSRPYSTAVRVDNMLYLSGALGIVPGTGALAEGGIQAETRQTLENISASLTMFGSSMENVVKCTVYLADIAEWGAMNEVYTGYFPNKPARSAIGNSGLGLDARIEIECMAVIR